LSRNDRGVLPDFQELDRRTILEVCEGKSAEREQVRDLSRAGNDQIEKRISSSLGCRQIARKSVVLIVVSRPGRIGWQLSQQ
jgi:hypothetical protein